MRSSSCQGNCRVPSEVLQLAVATTVLSFTTPHVACRKNLDVYLHKGLLPSSSGIHILFTRIWRCLHSLKEQNMFFTILTPTQLLERWSKFYPREHPEAIKCNKMRRIDRQSSAPKIFLRLLETCADSSSYKAYKITRNLLK